ncbi:MAG TPA: peptidylprolyl isomerase [Bryobacteraceae bacterium]|nr:peptidylprolyl isomerase [Bryobacteraceae bacterium]
MRLTAVLMFMAAVAAAQQPRPAASKPAARSKPAAAKTKPRPAAEAAATSTPAAQPQAAQGKVVLRIGSETVTDKEFDALVESLPENARAQARGPMKRQLAEQIVRVKLLAAEARNKGMDKDPALQARMRFQMDNMLAGLVFNDINKNTAVSEADVRKYYDEHKNEYEQASARHILIKFKGSPVQQREGKPELSEEQALAKAQELRKRIQGGEEFAKVAKAESDDVGSGANGGDLGTFGRGQMVPEFDKAVFSQPVGQLGEPLKTQFGYHLIEVTKRDTKTFDQTKTDIEGKMRPERARDAVEQLRQKATVTLDPEYFGPETPAASPAVTPSGPTNGPPQK